MTSTSPSTKERIILGREGNRIFGTELPNWFRQWIFTRPNRLGGTWQTYLISWHGILIPISASSVSFMWRALVDHKEFRTLLSSTDQTYVRILVTVYTRDGVPLPDEGFALVGEAKTFQII